MDTATSVKAISTLQIKMFIAVPGECFGVCFVEDKIIADLVGKIWRRDGLVSFMECLLKKLCCRFGKKRFFVERKATVQGLVVGLAKTAHVVILNLNKATSSPEFRRPVRL